MNDRERPEEPGETTLPAEVSTEDATTEEVSDLDLEVERIDTQGVLKEGFAGQEM